MKLFHTLIALAALTLTAPLSAHTDEYLDTIATPHGGQMRMAGAYHFELVVEPGTLTVYVTDHADQAVATEGATGSAALLVGRDRATIALKPAGGNTLKGSGAFAMDEAMRVVISIALPGQPAEQARFTPLAPRLAPVAAGESGGDAHHH